MGAINGSARVQVTVEFSTSAWGKDCSLSQVFDQAGREITNRVTNLIFKEGGRIIGQPKVIAVLAPDS